MALGLPWFTLVYHITIRDPTWPYMGWSGVSICWIGGFGLVRGISSHYKSLQFWPKDSTTLPSPHFGRCCSSLEHGLALIIFILWFHMIPMVGKWVWTMEIMEHHGGIWWPVQSPKMVLRWGTTSSAMFSLATASLRRLSKRNASTGNHPCNENQTLGTDWFIWKL